MVKQIFLERCWTSLGDASQAFSQGPEIGRPILVQQYIYSKEREGGGEGSKNVPLEILWILSYFMSVSVPGSLEIFQNTWLCEFVPLCFLVNYDIFIQPGTPSNLSKCQMYNNNENWSYFVSDILIYLGKSLKIISHFPRNLGVQRRPFSFKGRPGHLDALLAKSLMLVTTRWGAHPLHSHSRSAADQVIKTPTLHS
jgi:hypothetical protein